MAAETVIIPARLKKGDCIGLFAPAGPIRDPDRLAAGIRLLHDLGFTTKMHGGKTADLDYLAADDRTRAKEFHDLWADDAVKGMMAVRGGYGCLRIINDIRFDLLRSCPKVMIGFSDLTVLLNTISSRSGLMTVHGPVVSSLTDCDRESIQALTTLLAGGLPRYPMSGRIEILRSGTAKGILRGGNLTSLVHLVGTPWELPWDNTLLLLEDTGEPMYKIDRMLTQLDQGGRLKGLAGILLGSFGQGGDPALDSRLEEQVWQRCLELTDKYGYPLWGGFPVGHNRINYPVPLGVSATMDSNTGVLDFHRQLL